MEKDRLVATIRHTVPYGDLETRAVQRFGSFEDLDSYKVTIEGREEYEPLIGIGLAVFASVDYHAILHRAEDEADIVIWDEGINDFSFIKSDLHIVLVYPRRPGHETSYRPGETNLRMADKVDSATKEQLAEVQASAQPLPGLAFSWRWQTRFSLRNSRSSSKGSVY